MIPLAVDWHDLLLKSIIGFNEYVIYYFITLNSVYLLLFLVSLVEVVRFVRRTFFSDYQQILKSEMTLPISILVPAHNEERGIVDTVRSLLQLNYGEFEILVVNDGSKDGTLERLVRAFDLRTTDRIYRRTLPTGKVRGIYASLEVPNLTVVDKEKGGKSDALNAGINLSRYPLFCSVDADSVIEENALLRVVKPFMEHPEEMVAVGGIVRIVNGCEVRDGRVVKIGLPRRALPVFQVVEYLRAFLSGRIGWSVLRSLLIISGAFGLYKKSEVIEVGGYDSNTDTEDLELVVKLHEGLKRRKVEVPHRLRPRPGLLDGGPGEVQVPAPAAQPVAPRAAPVLPPPLADAPQPEIRRHRRRWPFPTSSSSRCWAPSWRCSATSASFWPGSWGS